MSDKIIMCNYCYEHFKAHCFPNIEQMEAEDKYQICPIDYCHGKLRLFDRNIAAAVRLLNEKNYITMSSSGGSINPYYTPIYIRFEDDYSEYFSELPYCFTYDKEKRELIGGGESDETDTEYNFLYLDPNYDEREELSQLAKWLYEWAESLPEREIANTGFRFNPFRFEDITENPFTQKQF